MKKFFAVIFSVLLLASSAAGCQTSNTSTSSETVSRRGSVASQESVGASDESEAENKEDDSSADDSGSSLSAADSLKAADSDNSSSAVASQAAGSDNSSLSAASQADNDSILAYTGSKDISSMKNPMTFKKFAFDLPENFEIDVDESEDEGAPLAYDIADVNEAFYIITDVEDTDDPDEYTKEDFDEMYADIYEEDYKGIDSFEKANVSGFPALKTTYKLADEDDTCVVRDIYVFTDDNVYILSFYTFTEDYVDDYQKAVTTIVVE